MAAVKYTTRPKLQIQYTWGHARVYGNARIDGNARICANISKHTLTLQGSVHDLIILDNGVVQIGCELAHISEWLDKYQEIGLKHRYRDNEINEYYHYLQLANQIIKIKG